MHYASEDLKRDEAITSSVVPARRGGGMMKNSRAYLMALIGFMGIFLFGYDTGLGGGVLKLPSFQKDFGLMKPNGDPVDNLATLQGNIVSILQGGAFFGALFAAPIENGIGRKRCLMIGCVIFIAGGVIQTACFRSLNQFYIGRLLAGIGVGIMSSACPTYASEIAPKEIRGRITGLFQIVVVVGVAFSFWISYGVSYMDPVEKGAMQWRVPIGFQLVPVGIMMILLPFLKESPRWLAVKHRDEKALANLAWIRKTPIDDPDTKLEFAEIQAAIEEEEATKDGRSFVHEILAKGNPKRFIIAFVMFTLQQWSGQNSISYYAPIIFESIGITGTHTGLLTSGIYGIVKIVATALFIFLGVERFGRKKPLLIGIALMSMFLWIIGAVLNTNPPPDMKNKPVGWEAPVTPAAIAMAVMIYLYVIPYCFSVGPLPWVICSEIFGNRTRHYGLTTAAASQWLWNFAVSMSTPHMAKALKNGGMFFFFATINIISFILAYVFLPETKGISLEGMDIIFGATTVEQREADLQARARALHVEDEKEIAQVSYHEVDERKKSRDSMV